MNVSAVSLFLVNYSRTLPDGISLYDNDGRVLFEMKNTGGKSIGHYVCYLIRHTDDPNKVLNFGIRIPDHSELGATRVGWQMRLKTLIDKSVEEFRGFIKDFDEGKLPVVKNIAGFTAGGYDPLQQGGNSSLS